VTNRKKRAPARRKKTKAKAKVGVVARPSAKRRGKTARAPGARGPEPVARPLGALEQQRLLDAQRMDDAGERELERMARAEDPKLRALVAVSPRAPRAALEVLAKDDDVQVRRQLARSTRLGRDLAQQLLADPDDQVRSMVVWSAPPEQLGELGRDPSSRVRAQVAVHRNVTVPLLVSLAADRDRDVRMMVAIGPLTPWGIVRQLCQDPDDQVWKIAQQQLKRGSRLCDCCGENHGLPDPDA